MAETKIEWCSTILEDGTSVPGYTFNPWIGCMKVSRGCTNCYAEELMTRKPKWANTWGPAATTNRIKTSDSYWKKPLMWNKKSSEMNVRLKVFCGSLMDVFEDNIQVAEWRQELFNLIGITENLDWLLLTKRPENIMKMWSLYTGSNFQLFDNIWIGTSIEDQPSADKRIPHLLNVPAKVRFVSAEPLLGPINLFRNSSGFYGDINWDGYQLWSEAIDWAIIGGESGNNYRNMELMWMYELSRACSFSGTAVFIKQDNAHKPGLQGRIPDYMWRVKEYPNPITGGIINHGK